MPPVIAAYRRLRLAALTVLALMCVPQALGAEALPAPDHCYWKTPPAQQAAVSIMCWTKAAGWDEYDVPADFDETIIARAAAGNPRAMGMLGGFYLRGYPKAFDAAKGLDLLRRAAAGGYGNAMNDLGAAYLSGRDVPPDDALAREWFIKAMRKGSFRAMENMANLYATGHGVARDDVLARELWREGYARFGAASGCDLGRFVAKLQGHANEMAQACRDAAHPAPYEMPQSKAAPTPGLRWFAGWLAVCSNRGDCWLYHFDPTSRGGDGRREAEGYLMIALPLDGAPHLLIAPTARMAPPRIRVDGRGRWATDGGASLCFPDDPVPDSGCGPRFFAARVPWLIDAMRHGSRLRYTGAPFDVPLAGFGDAWLWAAMHQVRGGAKSAPAPVAPASALPPLKREQFDPRLRTSAIALARQEGCTETKDHWEQDLWAVRLSATQDLILLRCGGTYPESIQLAIIGDETTGAASLADLPFPPDVAALGRARIDSPAWYYDSLTLISDRAAAAGASCSTALSWRWDGATFRLTREALDLNCHGVVKADWPVLWQADQ